MGLLDFLRSASNAVASQVAGPVDLINSGLGMVGIPTSKAPIGGTEWMKQRGLVTDVPQGPARVLGEAAGLLAPTLMVAKAPQIAQGLLKMQENALKPATNSKELGAIVWHGSPHKFDKFDSSKIGTGEGAQAYGHGLYLAESPGVAKSYAEALAPKRLFFDNVLANPDSYDDALTKTYIKNLMDSGDTMRAADMTSAQTNAKWKDILALKNRATAVNGDGSFYKVDLPDDQIAKMLDWDKPLSQQAQEVKAAIRKTKTMLPPNAMDDLGGDLSLLYGPELTGADLLGTMNSLQPNFGETALQRVGVPGIRYLDGGSRGAGAGTSNFVVFPGNEGLLTILERNGQGLLK